MGVRYDYLPPQNTLVVTIEGAFGASDTADSNARVQSELAQHPGLRLMLDLRTAELPDEPATMLTMIEAYFDLIGHHIPIALITAKRPGDHNPMLFETKAFIAGAPMRNFGDIQPGLAWLERQ